MKKINQESMTLLIDKYKDDEEAINIVNNCLDSFLKYHESIYRMETYIIVFGRHDAEEITALDAARTIAHNSVISHIKIINRMCDNLGIAPIYTGVVSEYQPHRKILADAVLDYVAEIIKNRI